MNNLKLTFHTLEMLHNLHVAVGTDAEEDCRRKFDQAYFDLMHHIAHNTSFYVDMFIWMNENFKGEEYDLWIDVLRTLNEFVKDDAKYEVYLSCISDLRGFVEIVDRGFREDGTVLEFLEPVSDGDDSDALLLDGQVGVNNEQVGNRDGRAAWLYEMHEYLTGLGNAAAAWFEDLASRFSVSDSPRVHEPQGNAEGCRREVPYQFLDMVDFDSPTLSAQG